MNVLWTSPLIKTTIFLKISTFCESVHFGSKSSQIRTYVEQWASLSESDGTNILHPAPLRVCTWTTILSGWMTRWVGYEVECTDCRQAFPSVASDSVFFVPQCSGRPTPRNNIVRFEGLIFKKLYANEQMKIQLVPFQLNFSATASLWRKKKRMLCDFRVEFREDSFESTWIAFDYICCN